MNILCKFFNKPRFDSDIFSSLFIANLTHGDDIRWRPRRRRWRFMIRLDMIYRWITFTQAREYRKMCRGVRFTRRSRSFTTRAKFPIKMNWLWTQLKNCSRERPDNFCGSYAGTLILARLIIQFPLHDDHLSSPVSRSVRNRRDLSICLLFPPRAASRVRTLYQTFGTRCWIYFN